MGWRSKFIFLLIVYFAGFATAIYYLAPSGRGGDYQAGSYSCSSGNESQGSGSALVKEFCGKAFAKASASFSSMDSKGVKESFNRGVQKLIEMVKNSRSNEVEGAEDK
jgi:hypothetical protein